MNDDEEAWLATRPECVQRLAAEFPLNTVVDMPDGKRLYLCGYTEDDRLILSEIDPAVDYDAALAQRTYLCAEHLRAPSVRTSIIPAPRRSVH